MRYLTLQQLFNKIVKGMKKQNWQPCTDKEGNCKYRYKDKRCPVGHVITDSAYSKKIEDLSVESVICDIDWLKFCGESLHNSEDLATALNKSKINPEHYYFLNELQKIHDNVGRMDQPESYIIARFKKLGAKYKLKWPIKKGAK